MITTTHKYSPSVNIVWDREANLNYIPTPNTQRVFNQLLNDYLLGIRSFNIIGAYGSGKSSFLWAFEKNLNRQRKDFSGLNGHFNSFDSFEFLPVVGQYGSIIESLRNKLRISPDIDEDRLINELEKYYQSLKKSNKALLIVVDEFGKFLEFAAKTNPEKELYFIQQLTEYVNNPNRDILFIITLHQDFNAYALGLKKSQRQEWDKVKGRLKEITFNEPVEQLLYLASERLDTFEVNKKKKGFAKLYKAIKDARAFPLRDYFDNKTAKKLLPFDILSAAILTLALQKYGQNERSLFTFIESNDYLGIKDFNQEKNPYYNLSCVYDYLIHNYYSLLSTKYNPDYIHWRSIRECIQRAEGIFDNDSISAIKLIKTIGLLNIFSSASAKIDRKFLKSYGISALGINSPENIIDVLESHKIVRYVKHSSKYILFEGTDIDIDLELEKASAVVTLETNIINQLNRYFDFPFIPAKSVYYEKGTPRYFAFALSEHPIATEPEGEVDGYINLIFSNEISEDEIREISFNCKNAILYGFFKDTDKLKELIFEIEKAKYVRQNNLEDRVAVRELDSIINNDVDRLNNYVLKSIYSPNPYMSWYYNGKKVKIDDEKSFNRTLSNICNDVYSLTPFYNNEMVNKTKVSSSISNARRNLLSRLVNHSTEEELGIAHNKFPPEKTIYLSMLKNTGIHRRSDSSAEKESQFILDKPENGSFKVLWKEGRKFLESARYSQRNLQELFDLYSNKPYKLKKGLVDFWVPIFLLINKDQYALFQQSKYIPYLNEYVLDLLLKKPSTFEIKTFNLNKSRLDFFNEYRKLINKTTEENVSNAAFIETIRPFLVLYKDLTEYSKSTTKISEKAVSLRTAIKNSKSPEETFFESFPIALGYTPKKLIEKRNGLENYFSDLRETINEIRNSYGSLIDRVENFITDEIVGENLPFPEYKEKLQKRYKKLKTDLLLPHQLVFYQRLYSELDDKESWINSVVYSCVGKSLDRFDDTDENVLYEKLSSLTHELDNLCDISSGDIEFDKEDAFKVEITSYLDGLQKSFIRLPKNKNREIEKLEKKIIKVLGEDTKVNIMTLTKLLQRQLKNGEKN